MSFRSAFSFLKRLFPFFGSSFMYLSDKLAFDMKSMKVQDIVPSIVILGAQKSGTTTLANYLDKHDDIYLTKPMKEGGYFLGYQFMRKYFQSKGIKIYGRYDCIKNFTLKGYQGEKMICEATTFYTLNNNVAKQSAIKYFNQNQQKKKIKFIYIIRNPYERLISHYKHIYKQSSKLSFQDFLLTHHSKPIKVSQYAYQLNYYKESLKEFDCKIVFFEDLVTNYYTVLNDLHLFLKIESGTIIDNKLHENKSIKVNRDKLELDEAAKLAVKEILERDKQILNKKYKLNFPARFSEIPQTFN
jgi:hypothetical protein